MYSALCCVVIKAFTVETEEKLVLPIASTMKISRPICHAKHGLKQVTWQSFSHKQMLIWMLIKIYKTCVTVFFFFFCFGYML